MSNREISITVRLGSLETAVQEAERNGFEVVKTLYNFPTKLSSDEVLLILKGKKKNE